MLTALLALAGPAAADDFCMDCLSIRLDPPQVVRGPFPDEIDNAFAMLKLKDGTWRGFSANGATYAIDGTSITDMGGTRRAVLKPGPKGSATECGRWLNGALPVGDVLYGLVHQESGCDYDHGQTHKSMAMATSRDDGLTWTDLGDIITGVDPARPGAITGEGDCTMVDGGDGYAYAYCLRNSDSRTIVARAPRDSLGPGNWRKFFDGGWDSDALGGQATALGFFGVASANLTGLGRIALVVTDPWFHGVRLSLSADKVQFTDLAEPLLPIDGEDWNRPAPTDLIAYLSVLNPEDGSNTVGNDFFLAMAYLAPGDTFAHRYLVFQHVTIAHGAEPVSPQVGIALARWRSSTDDISRATTGPVVQRDDSLDKRLGYLMTRAPDGDASVKLEECQAGRGYRLDVDGACGASGFTRLRTAGWAYDQPHAGTLPLYRCAASGGTFISNDPTCEGRGSVETRLGFALSD